VEVGDAGQRRRCPSCRRIAYRNPAVGVAVVLRDANTVLLGRRARGLYAGLWCVPCGYVEWDEDRQIDWAVRYWQRARKAGLPVDADFSTFWRDFEWMGVQRQLKVLGIFARLYHRDGKSAYLADMPRVLRYLCRACERYDALRPLRALLDEIHGGAA